MQINRFSIPIFSDITVNVIVKWATEKFIMETKWCYHNSAKRPHNNTLQELEQSLHRLNRVQRKFQSWEMSYEMIDQIPEN